MSSRRKARERKKPLSENQVFCNALRNALGKAPLYGPDDGFGGVESYEDTQSGSGSDEWFSASEGPSPVLGRDEWRDAKTTAASARKRERARTVQQEGDA